MAECPDPAVTQDFALKKPGLPPRFAGALGLCAVIVLGVFLLPFDWGPVVQSPILVPLLTCVGFLLYANLFLVAFGPSDVGHRTLLSCFVATFLGSIIACGLIDFVGTAVGSSRVWPGAFGKAGVILWLLRLIAYAIALRHHASGFWEALLGHVLGTGLIEESVKLIPVLIAISHRKIVSARGAILAGALSGLGFGLIEGNDYAYRMYLPNGMGLGMHLIRFLSVAPLHGVWTALAAFLASQMWITRHPVEASEERSPWLEFLLCIGLGALLHGLYNAFGVIGWWIPQWLVILVALACVAGAAGPAWCEPTQSNLHDACLPWRAVLQRRRLDAGALSVLFLVTSLVLSSLFAGSAATANSSNDRSMLQQLVQCHDRILAALEAAQPGALAGVRDDLADLDLSAVSSNTVQCRDTSSRRSR